MRPQIKQWVASCPVCQQTKYVTASPAGLLQPLPIPNRVWEDISMDFIPSLPSSSGKTTILVVVDRLSKYAHFLALPPNFTATTVAEAFATGIFKLHGIPKSIVTDRDPIFLSRFWADFFKKQGTSLQYSTAYHPQSDGQTEVLNRTLEQYLRCFVMDHPHQWLKFLHWAEYWYNTSVHSATGLTPYEALYGRPPPAIPDYFPNSSSVDHVDLALRSRDDILAQLKLNLQHAQHRMKTQYDRHHTDKTYQVNDWVFVKLQPYRQTSVSRHHSHKFARRFYGPFQIEEKIGPVAYRLRLPASSKIHPTFHVSLLKPCIGDPSSKNTLLPPVSDSSHPLLVLESILDARTILKGRYQAKQLLVQWSSLPPEDATWEDIATLQAQFPQFQIKDDLLLRAGRNVTTPSPSSPANEGSCSRQPSMRPKNLPDRYKEYWMPK